MVLSFAFVVTPPSPLPCPPPLPPFALHPRPLSFEQEVLAMRPSTLAPSSDTCTSVSAWPIIFLFHCVEFAGAAAKMLHQCYTRMLLILPCCSCTCDDGRSSVVMCAPETGRTHQIRVHLQVSFHAHLLAGSGAVLSGRENLSAPSICIKWNFDEDFSPTVYNG